MKKIIFLASLAIALVVGLSILPMATKAESLGAKLSGRVLLAVQSEGEAWYVNPVNLQRYFLGDSLDALNIMSQLGLGISNKDFSSFNGVAPKKLSGRILLKVEDRGEAYYVNPADLKMKFLGKPEQALKLMHSFGLGITNSDLAQLPTPKNGNVSITSSGFSPMEITVNQGAMITWSNFSNSVQTVTSPNNFDFGDIDSGKTYSRMFNTVGTYHYYSSNNRSLTGTIIVK